MKKGLAVVVIALLLGATVFEDMHRRITKNLIGYGSADADPVILPSSEHEQIRMRAMALHSYALEKKFNTNTFFVIDMAIASGKNRFFVYENPRRKSYIRP